MLLKRVENEIKKQASDSRDIRVKRGSIQIIHITLGDYNTGDTRNSRLIGSAKTQWILREHCMLLKMAFYAKFDTKFYQKPQISEGKSAHSEFWYIFFCCE